VGFFVGILVVILGFMAFAVDTGFLFHARRLAQNAADASVLAGAQELEGCGDGIPSPVEVAFDYAQRNFDNLRTFGDLGDDNISPVELRPDAFQIPGTDTYLDTVYTRVSRDQSFLFGRLFGADDSTIPAHAEAACVSIDSTAICPFYIQSPAPDEEHFGLVPVDADAGVYPVYRFKFGSQSQQSSGNRGFLGIYGSGANQIRLGIEGGCLDPDDELEYVVSQGSGEGDPDEIITDSQTGNIASIWMSFDDLYEYEEDVYGPGVDCNIEFDYTQFEDDTPYYVTVNATDPAAAAASLATCKENPPGSNWVIRGRYFPIVITDSLESTGCTGNCTITTDHIAMMYVVCWGPDCDNTNPGQASLFGMFIEDYPFIIKGKGVSDNPLAPKRPLLVR
jgi:hypothetical protein